MTISSLIRLLANPQEIAAVAERKATGAAFLLLAGLAFITAIGLASASLWLVIAPDLGPAGAFLVLAGGFVMLALVLLLIGWLTQRQKAPPPPVAASAPDDPILALVASLFGNNQAAMLAGTLVAGFLAERAKRRKAT